MVHGSVQRRLAAILSADAVGYTRLMAADEVATLETLNASRDLMGGLVRQHQGRVVDAVGDNLLAEFASAVDAVECALEIQRQLETRNEGIAPDTRMQFRIGINVGDLIVDGERVVGDGVNIAARIQALAEPGGLTLSSSVLDQVQGKVQIEVQDLGEQSLKNVPRPVRVFQVGAARLDVSGDEAARGVSPSVPGFAGRHAIAVLPFQNLSGDESIDYLRLAVPDEITTALSRAPSLSVRPFAMTARYAGAVVDPGQASRELGAANIVTGQYFKQGQQLHLTLEAIDVEESRVLWRESLPVQSDDLIALRRTVAGRIESGLLPQLGAAAPGGAGADLPENPEAYRLFMRGLGTGKDPQPNKRAIELLEQAVALEDTYAPAWAELSVRYYYDGNYAFGGHEAHDRAEQAARRALELDPTLTGASLRLIVLQVEKGDLTGAYDEATTLLARNPSSPEAHFVLGYVLRYAGLLDEALRECDAALALDPTNPGWRSCGITAYMAGEYDRARQFLALDASSEWSRSNQIGVALRTGELGRAAEIGRTLPQDPFGDWLLACIENRPVPDPEFAAQYEQFWSTVRDSEQLYWSASMLAFCDEPERALRMLRAAIEKNYCSYPLLNNDPLLGAVRALPGFADVREQARACRERFLAHRAARRSG